MRDPDGLVVCEGSGLEDCGLIGEGSPAELEEDGWAVARDLSEEADICPRCVKKLEQALRWAFSQGAA